MVRDIDPQEIDALGHVNNAVYLHWVQDIAVAHWTKRVPQAVQDEFLFVVIRHEIDYRAPLLLGDFVELRTWLGAVSGPRFERFVDIRKQGAERFSARAKTTWCMLERNTNRPRRVGSDILEAFGLSSPRGD